MTKQEILEMEEARYQEFCEQYKDESLTVLVDRLNQLERTVGSDQIEIQAIKDTIETMDCDMNPYAE